MEEDVKCTGIIILLALLQVPHEARRHALGECGCRQVHVRADGARANKSTSVPVRRCEGENHFRKRGP